jgi:phosphonate transport system substrate-binding protein
MLKSIKVISIQSPGEDDTCEEITHYLGDRLGIPTEFVRELPWRERERLLDSQQAHIGWICGLPYIRKVEKVPTPIELLAAPVMNNPRYHRKPVYYSDVIVHQESGFHSFGDLRDATWAYNEPHSQSGYNVTLHHLARLGESKGYFGKVVEAGSHLRAIEMVLRGEINACAIDSTVLDRELQVRPHLKSSLRVIEILGPSPIPPWVINKNVPFELREAIREIYVGMHKTTDGRAILAQGRIAKMVQVSDKDYDAIREMARMAEQVTW